MIMPVQKTGWIPYTLRSNRQKRMTDQYHERIGFFSERGQRLTSVPDRVIMHELEIKTTGGLLPRIWQQSGSCVGSGGARAYSLAQVGDVANRGDQEAIKIPFPFATYGVGRQISGARSTGEGSFGGAQAEAIKTFGMLSWDFENSKIPRPTIKDGWAAWTSREEIQWSHPSGWPVSRSTLDPDAGKYKIQDVTQAESTDDLVQGLAQGFSGTMACMFGTRACKVQGDVLMAPWNDQWAHQQCIAGYWQHPKLGLIFLIDNQWNDVHGHCPTLYPFGVTGSYWILEKDMTTILRSRDGEVYLHSNTMGFPLQTIDWGYLGIAV